MQDKDIDLILGAFTDMVSDQEPEKIDNVLDFTAKTADPNNPGKEGPEKIATGDIDVMLTDGVEKALEEEQKEYERKKKEEEAKEREDKLNEGEEKMDDGVNNEVVDKEEVKEEIQQLKEEAEAKGDEDALEKLEKFEDDLDLGLDAELVLEQLEELRNELNNATLEGAKAKADAEFWKGKYEELVDTLREKDAKLVDVEPIAEVISEAPEIRELVLAYGRYKNDPNTKDDVVKYLDKIAKDVLGVGISEALDKLVAQQQKFAEGGVETKGTPKINKDDLSAFMQII